jgi:membrane-associated protease RseP (regulator of RpoE activity)
MFAMRSFLALAVLMCLWIPGAQAQESDSDSEPTEQERKELETKLDAARERLEEAAREVAELSGKLTGPIAHDFFVANRMHRGGAMIGIGIGSEGEDGHAGVSVENVLPDGPADKAGLKSGDLIVSVDGKSLQDGKSSPNRALIKHMRGVEPGKKIKVEYMRDGKKQTTEVTAEAMNFGWATLGEPGHRVFKFHRMQPHGAVPAEPGVPAMPPIPIAPFTSMEGPWMHQFVGPGGFDMELVTLTPKLGRYFGADRGVLVVRAPSDSSLKVEEGDVILDVDGREPTSGIHAMRILSSYQPGEKVTFNVLRDRKNVKVQVTVPQSNRWGRGIEARPRTFKIPTPPPREEST